MAERQTLALGRFSHDRDGVVDERARGRRALGHGLDLPGLDLREVEDVVDDCQQRGAGAGGCGSTCSARRIGPRSARVEQQVGVADHAVERRADLVAHGGQELALGGGCRQGAIARPAIVPRAVGQQRAQAVLVCRHQCRRDPGGEEHRQIEPPNRHLGADGVVNGQQPGGADGERQCERYAANHP